MGGITFYLFLVLTITGVLLMFGAGPVPTKGQAYRDIMYIMHDVPFGNFTRNMHRSAPPYRMDHHRRGCTCSACP
jgi:quinol-cytochrome oxidoreductase complex cytochrome b subunit